MRKVAIFDPVRRETVRPHMLPLIGAECAFELSHEITEGQFAGQKAWQICRDDPRYDEAEGSWIPDEDLREVR